MTKQENIQIPSFHLGQVVPPNCFVDRVEEIEYCKKIIHQNKGNLLLIGKWRIGKTSLLNKLADIIESDQTSRLLLVQINLAVYFDRDINNFLQDLLIHICATAAKVLYQKEYSEMLRALGSVENVLGGDFKKLLRIFEMVRATESTRGRQTNSTVGSCKVVPVIVL